jgi:hypothetical protein
MTIADILEKAINKEFSYADACYELKKLHLDEDSQEKYEALLYKLLGKESSLVHDDYHVYECIPDVFYPIILEESIIMVREGAYSNEVAQALWEKYHLSSQLLSYFVNEAVTIVRMNRLTPEEIASVGEAYHQIASELEAQGLKEKPVIEQGDEINAEPVQEIVIRED